MVTIFLIMGYAKKKCYLMYKPKWLISIAKIVINSEIQNIG